MEENQRNSQFEAIFAFANESILVVDANGIVRQVNPSGQLLFGYKEAELIGHKIELLIPERFKPNHVNHRTDYVVNPHARHMGKGLELYGLKKNGNEFPLEISLSPYTLNGESFIIAFIIDISARKAIEAKEKNYRLELEKEVQNRTLVLKEAINKLEKTKDELDESLQREKDLNVMKSRFISIASHEFRTPLSTMLSSMNLIEKYNKLNDDEKRDKHIERIKQSIKLLTEILNDILSVNKLEEGKVIVNPAEVELIGFIQNIISEIKEVAKKGQRIVLNSNEITKLPIYHDIKFIRHILLNLISNAIKFSPENSAISIAIKKDKTQFRFYVIDKGIGIPEQNKKQLFERFYRAENVEQIQGTGLGLSIVAQYAQLMGGSVTFESSEGLGSEFCVELPLIYKE